MIGWVRGRRNAWRGRSRHAQVEASTRWSLVALPWIMLLAGLAPLPARAADTATATALAWSVLGVNAVLCATASVVLGRAFDAYLGQRPAPWGGVALLGAETAAAAGLTTWLVVADALRGEAAEGMALMVSTGVFLMPYTLLTRTRTTLWTLLGMIAAAVAVFGAAGVSGGNLVGVAVVTALGAGTMALSTRCSGWYISVMRELDEAREAQTRLAVAEERLRFGRDLHDVLGRNLSVIALKSELAVQLARRGGRGQEAAVDQMVEVQRIARDSQREVRDVVRGYRAADLTAELAGAQGVLRAAGTDCRTDDGDVRLPAEVRAALGWVVREGTTNVLRHAEATRCEIVLRADRATAVLTMENDGVHPADGGVDAAGSRAGLAGLRERLAALDGSLTAERPTPATFRLTATVPLQAGAERDAGVADRDRAGTDAGTDDAGTDDAGTDDAGTDGAEAGGEAPRGAVREPRDRWDARDTREAVREGER